VQKEWRVLTAVVAVALASAVAWGGYRYLEASTPASHPQTAVLGKGTEIFFRVAGGGRIDMTGMEAASLGMGGKSLADLLKAYPAWRVREATADEVVLVPRQGSDPISLGIRNGFVAVFLGSPKTGILNEVTGISAASLMTEDRHRLEKGVGVKNLTDAWLLLEGLAG